MDKPKSIEKLENCFNKLPTIGKKSAERLAFSLLDMDDDFLNEFSSLISNLKTNIHRCKICGMISEENICSICDDGSRDKKTLMVVANVKDVISIEKSNGYHGMYHVLNGELNISKGINVNSLNFDGLLDRIEHSNFEEIILATNPTFDGETTALYISKLLENKNIKVTRLAYGLQMGACIDYTDEITLAKALEGRRKI